MTDAAVKPSAAPEPIGFRHADSAIRAVRAHLCLWSVVVFALGADLGTKAWAFRTLDPAQARPFVPGVLEFQLSLNAGALFGMGPGRGTLFIVASVAALAFVIYLFAGSSRWQRGAHVALGLILAGALGNLYDRATQRYDCVEFSGTNQRWIGEVLPETDERFVVIRPWSMPDTVVRHPRGEIIGSIDRVGVVRDFLHFVPRIGSKPVWPWVFNVADVALVIGVCLLLIAYWRQALRCAPADAGDDAGKSEPVVRG